MLPKTTTEDFIRKAVELHGDSYSYAHVTYVGNKVPVTIKCNTCGYVFHQQPYEHIGKPRSGCNECANKLRGKRRMTQDEFIAKGRTLHGDDLDYSLVEYVDYNTKVQLRCVRHDFVYEMSPKKHMQRRGCKKCSNGYSQLAIDWLEFKAKIDETDICHHLNRGEYHIQGVGRVDGFSIGKNKVYEFHGSLYHGNPAIYDGAQVMFSNGKLACELYFKTVERELKVKQLGFDYEEIWDTEWKRMKRSAKIIQHAWRQHKKGQKFTKLSRYRGRM